MSVTKSVTSALVGVAIGQGHLQGPDQKISDILPAHVFASTDVKNSFSNLSLRDVLGMSALNAPVAPHDGSAVAQKRLIDWFKSQNRLVFALSQPLLARPGTDFQYTDITPTLAAGAIEYATGQSLFDYANENLLKPMGFVNQEWMHEDPSGIDNGAYGLRLRPIDMQKFGVLYLNRGCWEGSDLIPESWVEQSFTPWITSGENTYPIDYGWYWWKNIWTTDWVSYGAVGWKGQRIEVFPQQNIVVSMTALIDDGSENRVFSSLIHNYIIHLNDPMPTGSDLASLKSQLASELASIRGAPTRIPTDTEFRMVPSAAPKENHFRFNPQ